MGSIFKPDPPPERKADPAIEEARRAEEKRAADAGYTPDALQKALIAGQKNSTSVAAPKK